MKPSPPIITLDYHEVVLERLAEDILQAQAERLPSLEQVVVLLPEPLAAAELRRLLLHKARAMGHEALLGPTISDLRPWLSHQAPAAQAVLAEPARELILVEALREHPTLFGHGNVWSLADSLLRLFDELTLNQVTLPESLAEFRARLAQGYGTGAAEQAALHREAHLIHTLWRAWHVQLEARDQLDRPSAYLQALAAERVEPHTLYLAGYSRFSQAERNWLAQRLEEGRTHLYLQGPNPFGEPPRAGNDEAPYSTFMRHCFDRRDSALGTRARGFAAAHSQSPLAGRLALFSAEGSEEEARAIDLQVRCWLLEGRQRIGIITENRRQARRVRALLERAGIVLLDAAGWALSTTSAAAALERWLECLEEDFPHQALLDLLKSPFVFSASERQAHLNTVYRFEQDIVRHENIGRNLQRYREGTRSRRGRLVAEMGPALAAIESLLERIEQAAQPFAGLIDTQARPISAYLEALDQSLHLLGIQSAFAGDAAGQRILQELDGLARSAAQEGSTLPWSEFRTWLGRTLERFNFTPPTGSGQVRLMGLEQSRLQHFDALIIASCERESLPGNGASSPFFNDAVRRELALPTQEELIAERFTHFRRLLASAPQVLLSRRRGQDDEIIIASPWFEAIRAFHQMAYGDDLEDKRLHALLETKATEVLRADTAALPAAVERPRPPAPAALLPARFSASAYQQLMDCPYQFFAARCLRLEPTEAIREALQKSDYGNHIHRCLEAFHGGVKGLPGPFREVLTAANRPAAIALLQQISHQVFAADLEDNYLHRGWLKRWEAIIGPYIDWQIERERQWRIGAVEQVLERKNYVGKTTLHGKIDRLETGNGASAIIDYKTGAVPHMDEIRSGEAVQLPFYALLQGEGEQAAVEEALFLALEKDRVSAKNRLAGEELEQLTEHVGERLRALLHALDSGAALSAWGDEQTCSYCDMEGICRKQLWPHETEAV